MCGHALRPQALRQVPGHALHQAAGVHENQGRPVGAGKVRHPVIDLLPLLVGAHRAQLVAEHLDGEIHVAALAHVHDRGQRPRRADEEPRRRLHRPHRRGEPDALEAGGSTACFGHQGLEPLEGERQVRAALVPRHRVDLVHDDGAHVGEPAPARFRGEEDEERLRGGHHDVRRPAAGLAPLVRRGVAGAERGPDLRRGQPRGGGGRGQLPERFVQVPPYVIGQGLQRRDIEDVGAALELPLDGAAKEPVETGEEGSEGLAGAGGRREEDIAARRDQRPGSRLYRRGLVESSPEPLVDDRMEAEGMEAGAGAGRCGGHAGSIGTRSSAGKASPRDAQKAARPPSAPSRHHLPPLPLRDALSARPFRSWASGASTRPRTARRGARAAGRARPDT